MSSSNDDAKLQEFLKLYSSVKERMENETKEYENIYKNLFNNIQEKDGENEILKFNFAGKHYDIKRSILLNSSLGWNLFTCICSKKWEPYLLRDKNGRIYFDIEESWIAPILECFQHTNLYPTSDPIRIIGKNEIENKRIKEVIKYFHLHETLFQLEQHDQISGLQFSMVDDIREINALAKIFEFIYSNQPKNFPSPENKENDTYYLLQRVFYANSIIHPDTFMENGGYVDNLLNLPNKNLLLFFNSRRNSKSILSMHINQHKKICLQKPSDRHHHHNLFSPSYYVGGLEHDDNISSSSIYRFISRNYFFSLPRPNIGYPIAPEEFPMYSFELSSQSFHWNPRTKNYPIFPIQWKNQNIFKHSVRLHFANNSLIPGVAFMPYISYQPREIASREFAKNDFSKLFGMDDDDFLQRNRNRNMMQQFPHSNNHPLFHHHNNPGYGFPFQPPPLPLSLPQLPIHAGGFQHFPPFQPPPLGQPAPDSPPYQPTSPQYSPPSPQYNPVSPPYSPTSPSLFSSRSPSPTSFEQKEQQKPLYGIQSTQSVPITHSFVGIRPEMMCLPEFALFQSSFPQYESSEWTKFEMYSIEEKEILYQLRAINPYDYHSTNEKNRMNPSLLHHLASTSVRDNHEIHSIDHLHSSGFHLLHEIDQKEKNIQLVHQNFVIELIFFYKYLIHYQLLSPSSPSSSLWMHQNPILTKFISAPSIGKCSLFHLLYPPLVPPGLGRGNSSDHNNTERLIKDLLSILGEEFMKIKASLFSSASKRSQSSDDKEKDNDEEEEEEEEEYDKEVEEGEEEDPSRKKRKIEAIQITSGQQQPPRRRRRKHSPQPQSSSSSSSSSSNYRPYDPNNDPIVSFNIHGEIFSILKSTIHEFLPDSLLSIRFSGRWKEQQDDLDEHGNILLDVPREAFRELLGYIRWMKLRRWNRAVETSSSTSSSATGCSSSASDLEVMKVSEQNQAGILWLFDYFGITNIPLEAE